MSNAWLYVVTVLIWGSTWIAINYQLGEVPLPQSVFYRYVIAAAVLMAWCLLRGRPLAFGWRQHRIFAALGVLMFGLNYVAAYAAQLYISSAFNALMFSCLVWMNIINARIFLGVRSPSSVFIGAGLGLVGIAVLFWPAVQEFSLHDAVIVGGAISLLAPVLLLALSFAAKRRVPRMPPSLELNLLRASVWVQGAHRASVPY